MATGKIELRVLEGFATAEDREKYLHELVPGTREHFVCCWLLAEQSGYPATLTTALDDWTSKNQYDSLTPVYQNRRKLLTAPESGDLPSDLITLLRDTLGLSFYHSKQDLTGETVDTTPSELSAATLKILEEDSLVKRALTYESSASDFLRYINTATFLHEHAHVQEQLTSSGEKFLYYIKRGLGVPDSMSVGTFVSRVMAVMQDSTLRSWHGPFDAILEQVYGSFTLAQLQALGESIPALKERVPWGYAVAARLAPPSTVDLRVDVAARNAYLQTLTDFLEPLPHQYNALKHAVLYHRVKNALTGPTSLLTESDLVLQFLRIPRYSSTILTSAASYFAGLGNWSDLTSVAAVVRVGSSGISSRVNQSTCNADLSSAFAMPLPSQADDDALVLEALAQMLGAAERDALAPWDTVALPARLRVLQAETKLMRGNDAQRAAASPWPAELGSTSALAALRDRVELELCSWNQEYVPAGPGPFSLSFRAKGVKLVSLRVFEINTTAYYTEKQQEIPTDLELDGLLPHTVVDVPIADEETAAGHVWSPLAVYYRHVNLEGITRATRGLFIIDVTAGGQSTRAVVRKGGLRYVERRTVAGHVLTLLDENNACLPGNSVSVTVSGKTYKPKDPEAAQIVIPYSATGTRGALLLTVEDPEEHGAWSFSTLISGWEHSKESYNLEAGFFIDREALVRDNYTAKMIVRPKLFLQNVHAAPLGALRNVVLQLTSTDADNNSSTRVLSSFSLATDGESTATFAVPPNLRKLRVQLSADIEILADGSKQSLSAAHEIPLNSINTGSDTRDVFLRYVEKDGFLVYLIGKSGEPVPDVKLRVGLEHPVISTPFLSNFILKTDAQGRIKLGHLRNFKRITIHDVPTQAGGGGMHTSASFDLPTDVQTYPTIVHTVAPPADNTAGRSSQLALPWRPAADATTTTVAATDIRITRVVPKVRAERSVQYGGSISDAISEYLPADNISRETETLHKHVSYDAAAKQLSVFNLPAGEYIVTVKRPFIGCATSSPSILVRVLPSHNTSVINNVLTHGRLHVQANVTSATMRGSTGLSIVQRMPIQVGQITVTNDDVNNPMVRIVISGGANSGIKAAANKDVRVHVIATHFIPMLPAGAHINKSTAAVPTCTPWALPRTRHLAARTLGEEIQYVMDRQRLLQNNNNNSNSGDAGPTPGNLLPRPALLLNAWSLGSVTTATQQAAVGGSFNRYGDGVSASSVSTRVQQSSVVKDANTAKHDAYSNFDFLHQPSTLLDNIPLDEDGVASFPLSHLFSAAVINADGKLAMSVGDVCLTVVAADASSVAATTTTLSTSALTATDAYDGAAVPVFRDIAAATASGLDFNAHFTQSSQITSLQDASSHLDVAASATQTKIEMYGSIDRVFSLFSATSNNAQLVADWSWLTTWHSLSSAEKCAKYSKYASHELNVWTFFKDFGFFESVVRPYIACKRAKMFVDHFLLGHDLRAYMSPEVFAQLNAFEQALLCMKAETADAANAMAKRLREPADNKPLTAEQREAIFKAALASSALDGPQANAAMLQRMMAQAERDKAPPPRPMAIPSKPTRNVIDMERRRESSRAAPGGRGGVGGGMLRKKQAVEERSMAYDDDAEEEGESAPRLKAKSYKRSAAPKGIFSFASAAPRAQAQTLAMPSAPSMSMSSAVHGAAMLMMDRSEKMDAVMSYDEDFGGESEEDLDMREETREELAFRPLDKTEEYAETHYYRIRSESDTAQLIATHAFWADFAEYCAGVAAVTAGADMAALAARIRAHPFVSTNFGHVTSRHITHSAPLNEMLLALAVLGLPFEQSDQPPIPPNVSVLPGNAKVRFAGSTTPVIIFHQDLSTPEVAPHSTILCGQSYFDPADRYITERGIQREKYLPRLPSHASELPATEVIAGKVYGCLVVVTNVASYEQQLNILLHIPQGSLPVNNGSIMKTVVKTLPAYATERLEYFFYVPRPGDFYHYGVQICSDGLLQTHTNTTVLQSVTRLQVRDTTSWLWLSQMGSLEEVLAFLRTGNLQEVNISLLLWRCNQDKDTFTRIVETLQTRLRFDYEVWGYSVKYHSRPQLKQLLQDKRSLQNLLSYIFAVPTITSQLLTVRGEDGVGITGEETADAFAVIDGAVGAYDADSRVYEHLEYSPLINARAHQLGKQRKILNAAVERQYRGLLTLLAAKAVRDITASDLLALTYHLLLQDRVREAIAVFARIPKPAAAGASRNWQALQYDYLSAYLDFFNYNADGSPYNYDVAAAVVAKHGNHPIPKWNAKFSELAQQLREATGASNTRSTAAVAESKGDGEDAGVGKDVARESHIAAATSKDAMLSFVVEAGKAVVSYANVTDVVFRFYTMDIEVLFSTSPFLANNADKQGSELGKFAYLRPNGVLKVSLPAVAANGAEGEATIALPAEFAKQNVMVELFAPGTRLRKAMPYFATDLHVLLTPAYGRLKVVHASSGMPQSSVYVKVFYRTAPGEKGVFYKDGYTDARGVFDYSSISTDELSKAEKFAILVVSDKYGACVREVNPPAVQ